MEEGRAGDSLVMLKIWNCEGCRECHSIRSAVYGIDRTGWTPVGMAEVLES